MTGIDPAELSAYLDGEAPPARMLEIEAALARDAGLRAEYEALRRLDASWREAGGGAALIPEVQLPRTRPATPPATWLAGIVILLLAARLCGKFIEAMGPSLLINLAALAVVGAVVLAMGRRREA